MQIGRGVFFLLWSFGASTCWGLHPLITEDTGTQGVGNTQFELTLSLERDRDAATVSRRADPSLTVTRGVADTFDLFLTLPYLQRRTQSENGTESISGWSDTALGFKWRFWENQLYSLAIKPAILFPVGDAARGLGQGHTRYSFPLVLTRQEDAFALHAHVEARGNRNTLGEHNHLWHASVALEYAQNSSLKWVLDLGVDRNPVQGSKPHPVFLLGGAIFKLGQADVSVGYKGKLNAAAPDQTFLLGATWRTD